MLLSVTAWQGTAAQPLLLQMAFWPELGWPAALPGALLHVFLHGDWLHLLGNRYFLVLFGRNVECVFGRRRMLGLFFLHGWRVRAAPAGRRV
ncbi:MAG: rhomboid family intramembrane serine protease [Gammaproteobacteria bacterium]|nr:MAG: rhomboid family intramembrane serine protease [Gammaproteobacteria bacterium]